jgi:hypothetical protein
LSIWALAGIPVALAAEQADTHDTTFHEEQHNDVNAHLDDSETPSKWAFLEKVLPKLPNFKDAGKFDDLTRENRGDLLQSLRFDFSHLPFS